jgi:hypothetical protein
MRVLACASVGIRDEMDLRTLLNLQQEDGGWGAGWMYKFSSSGIAIGNRGLTTALAINAIEALDHLPKTPLYGLRLFGYQISSYPVLVLWNISLSPLVTRGVHPRIDLLHGKRFTGLGLTLFKEVRCLASCHKLFI